MSVWRNSYRNFWRNMHVQHRLKLQNVFIFALFHCQPSDSLSPTYSNKDTSTFSLNPEEALSICHRWHWPKTGHSGGGTPGEPVKIPHRTGAIHSECPSTDPTEPKRNKTCNYYWSLLPQLLVLLGRTVITTEGTSSQDNKSIKFKFIALGR